jgi:protein-tyrosine phosphatase
VWTDLHNHVIPGVDDGPRDVNGSAAAIRALAEEGVGRIVATPHFDGSLTIDPPSLSRRLRELDEGWARLREGVATRIRVVRGAEIKLDSPYVDFSDPRIRLGGGATVLVEFPYFTVPPRSDDVLLRIREAGYLPLVAHPERYQGLDPMERVVRSWLEAGAFLQVNAGSLLGRYGGEARDHAAALLTKGWVHCLASDYHGRGSPGLRDARDIVRSRLEEETGEATDRLRLLLEVNPNRLLRGETPVQVQPLPESASALKQLLRRVSPWS